MHAFYALLRPAWRPMSWLWVLLGLIVLLTPIDHLSEAVGRCVDPASCISSAWSALAQGAPVAPVRAAVWEMVALQSLWIGLIVGLARVDVQNTSLGWLLPGLRRKQLMATLTIGIALATMHAGLMVNTGGDVVLVATTFTLSLLWFLLPGAGLDAGTPGALRGLVFASVLLGGFTAESHHSLIMQYPVAIGLSAAVLGAVLIALLASDRAARQRIELTAEMDLMPLHRTRGRISDALWRPGLQSERWMDWVRAAIYETSPRGYIRTRVIQVFLIWVVLRVLDNPGMIFVVTGTQFIYSGTLLTLGLHHPLSRRSQGTIAYTGALVDAVTFMLAGAVSLFVLLQLPIPILPMPSSQSASAGEWFRALVCAFIFVPVLQLGGLRQRLSNPRRTPTNLAVVGWMIGYIIPASILYNVATERLAGSPVGTLAWLLGAFVLTQGLYWFMVGAHFRSADLVPNS